ncbi:glutathione S-transferase T3-like [Zingiber officinale]|uniref:glutathione S-transferase T3-like n=1 Tax=Zingiber officinale TaxID=94328 RepID=UPI001C4A772E|nr:glutathione S-transferase T3-like [Zingiber officinale]
MDKNSGHYFRDLFNSPNIDENSSEESSRARPNFFNPRFPFPTQHPPNFQPFPYPPPYYHNFQSYPNSLSGDPRAPFYTYPPEYWQSNQYFMQGPSHGINQLQSPEINSNESRRASVDAIDSDKGTPYVVSDSQFPPFSSEIGSDDIILNQAPEMGNESDEDHNKRTVWTVADDKLLAAAYTIMSEDSVVGNAQKSESFWKRVVTYFNTNRAKGAKKRTAEKAKSHWASLKKIVNKYNGIYNKWYNDRPSGWSDEDLMVRAHEEYKSTFKTTFQYEHVWRIVKDSPMYAPQSSDRRATKKKRTSESSGAHTDSSNPNTTTDIDDREIRFRPMGQKAAKRKGKERIGLLDELNQAMQQSMAQLEEYNNNKKVDQLIQAHQLLVMDTRGMTDEQLQNHLAICEQLKKKLNM